MPFNEKNSAQTGFTLIELVIVIVILGVLAAFALPRFADLSGEAETASVDGARGSVESAAGIVRSKALAAGEGNTTVDASSSSISLEGESIALQNGYLDQASIEVAAQLDDFTVAPDSEDAHVTVADPETDSPCFTFEGSAGADTPPNVTDVSNSWTTGSPGSCSP